jgi:protein-disulfide isomerase
LLAFVLVGILGCDSADDQSGSPSIDLGSDQILATVDGSPIMASIVDAPLRIELHDLEYAKFRARRDRLYAMISKRLGDADSAEAWDERVEIALSPPSPPRFEIPDSGGPTRGDPGAAVTLVEFLDFESSHSRQLQPSLLRILDRYGNRVRLQVREFPLPYHRYARQAAVSAQCAGEQGAYWEFHDMILLEQPNISPPEVLGFATRLGLDSSLLEACVESGRPASRIDRDLSLASELGVRRSATLFVNGLYLSGHPPQDEIERVIREELRRLGVDSSPMNRRAGVRPDAAASDQDAMQSAARRARRAELPKIPPEMLRDPEVVIEMTRAEVDHALADRAGLDRKLVASRAEFSGQRLLTVREVGDEDFPTRLGLEEDDVLLIVNGEFVTAEHDWIWDAFSVEDKVTLVIMRRGLPHTYEYRIR